MSGNNRGAMFAIGLIAGLAICLIFVAWAVPEFYQPTNSNHEYNSKKEHKPNDNDNLVNSYISPFVSSEDTLAQWIMTFFTMIMAVIAGLGAWWVRGTLVASQKAVKSAEDAVSVTRRIGEIQTRAYVWAVKPEIEFIKTNRILTGCRARVILENGGQTPAEIISESSTIKIVKADFSGEMPDGFIKNCAPNKAKEVGGFIPQNGTTWIITENSLNADEVTKWQSGEFAALIFANVIFEDIFQARFRVDVCLRCVCGIDGSIETYMYPKHNKSQYRI